MYYRKDDGDEGVDGLRAWVKEVGETIFEETYTKWSESIHN
jgi:hypothetical protein